MSLKNPLINRNRLVYKNDLKSKKGLKPDIYYDIVISLYIPTPNLTTRYKSFFPPIQTITNRHIILIFRVYKSTF